MPQEHCISIVKKQIDIIIDNVKNDAMEKPRLLRILFKLLSNGETFTDSQDAMDSPKIKEMYNSEPRLAPTYDLVSDELIRTYLCNNPDFDECVFKKLSITEHKEIHDYIDRKIHQFCSTFV